jgi:hypothetical protein
MGGFIFLIIFFFVFTLPWCLSASLFKPEITVFPIITSRDGSI